ncbi:MAG: nickel pincer cofactor biosynthesis protein LarB [Proteobacteria bacterium]|nr:nickel pincer cofactor biosynthesis protein LarB [Pseudomonadota bacterium]
MNVDALLEEFRQGRVTAEEIKRQLTGHSYADAGFARLDHHRLLRKGQPEVVFCQGKTPEHVAHIFQELAQANGRVLGTRANAAHFEAVRHLPGAHYDPISRVLSVTREPVELVGKVIVVSAGTADMPVAEEAARVAEHLGSRVVRHFDCGVAGIHRFLSVLDDFLDARAVVAVAGMDGALPSVVGGAVAAPVIAVPTSVGYGASFGGLAALLTMLNSCAPGVTVVNIDNGFGAGYMAHIINAQCVTASKG